MKPSQTPITDLITEMLKNCIPIEMILVAVRSMEMALSTRIQVDAVAENRRAWDREYRRNKRQERPPDPPDIHPIPPDGSNNALSFFKEDKSYQEVIKQESKKERKERGCKCPPDWKPNQKHYDEGYKLGMDRAAVDERAVRMREWCDANANRSITTKANWDQAFMGTWIKGSYSKGQNHGTTQKPGVVAVAKRWAEHFESQSNDSFEGNSVSIFRIPKR